MEHDLGVLNDHISRRYCVELGVRLRNSCRPLLSVSYPDIILSPFGIVGSSTRSGESFLHYRVSCLVSDFNWWCYWWCYCLLVFTYTGCIAAWMVHIVFPHSCSAVLSNPLTDPFCLHAWMVTVLPFLLSSCPRFF